MTSDQCPKCGSWFDTSNNQGYGDFIYHPDGVFSALDGLYEIEPLAHRDFFAWGKISGRYICSAKVCMVCGHIWGQAGSEQMKAWKIGKENSL